MPHTQMFCHLMQVTSPPTLQKLPAYFTLHTDETLISLLPYMQGKSMSLSVGQNLHLTWLLLLLSVAPVWHPRPGLQHSSPIRQSSEPQTRRFLSHTWAILFDSSFSYCCVVDAPMFILKVHLMHVSGVRWRFN